MAAANKFGYVVGTVVVFAKKDGSHSQKEVSCVSLDNFDDSLATSVAELDMANKYAACGFRIHKKGQLLLVFGGDTGGRFMVDKFKESYKNLQLTYTPLFGRTMQALVDGEKSVVRIMELQKEPSTNDRKAACCVSKMTKSNPTFIPYVIHLGDPIKSNRKNINVDERKRSHVLQFFTGAQNEEGEIVICGMVTIRLAGYLGHTLFRIWRSSAYFKKEYSFQLVDINDSWMQFEVLEDVQFHGSIIRLCSTGPGEVVHFIPETRILLCRQVIDVRLNGDMAYIYVMLGHSAKFAHDAYRCIFCKFNFKTGQEGLLRNIAEFDDLAKHYKTSLNAERTYNIINPPLVHIPLEKVVPFFLHVSLGMFKKTVTSFNTACRALDKLVLDPNIRNSATVEHLSVKLEEGLGKLEVARLRVGEQETAVMIAQERLVEIGEILGPIYAHWIRKDAVSIVSKRVSLEVLEGICAEGNCQPDYRAAARVAKTFIRSTETALRTQQSDSKHSEGNKECYWTDRKQVKTLPRVGARA